MARLFSFSLILFFFLFSAVFFSVFFFVLLSSPCTVFSRFFIWLFLTFFRFGFDFRSISFLFFSDFGFPMFFWGPFCSAYIRVYTRFVRLKLLLLFKSRKKTRTQLLQLACCPSSIYRSTAPRHQQCVHKAAEHVRADQRATTQLSRRLFFFFLYVFLSLFQLRWYCFFNSLSILPVFFFCSFRSSFLISTFSSVSIFVHQFSLSFSDFFNLVFTITFIFVGFLVIRTSTYDVRTRCFLACFDLLKSQKSTPSS